LIISYKNKNKKNKKLSPHIISPEILCGEAIY